MTDTIDYALLSTTTTLGRVRGFTIEVLYHLGEGPRRCCELVEITGKYHDYVYSYLRNMRIYGLAEKTGVYWKLTLLGREFLDYLNIVYNNIIEYGKKKERRKKEKRKKPESWHPKRVKQIRIEAFLRDSRLADKEKEVVEVLVDHYNKTGSKFLYFVDHYEIADRFEMHPDQVNQIFMNLKQDHVVYSFRDRRHNAWKIGLYKAFVEALTLQRKKE